MQNNKVLEQLFSKSRVIGLVGNRNVGKTSFVLGQLLNLKQNINFPIYALGIEPNLHNFLKQKGIRILYTKEDILNLRIKNAIIFIDEFGDLFDTKSQSKEQDKIRRFFNRIAHQNCFVLLATAQQNFWNKFMCGIVTNFIVMSVDFDSLVNGTRLKRIVMGLENKSDYFLDIPIGTYFVIKEALTSKYTFPYMKELDSKKENINPFKQAQKK